MTIQRIRSLHIGTVLIHKQGKLLTPVNLISKTRDGHGRVLVSLEGDGNRYRVFPRELEPQTVESQMSEVSA